MYTHETSVHNTVAAEQAVPTIMKLFSPASVIDVGCGIGTWLKVFKQHGITRVRGVDGDYVNRKQLFQNIQEREFVSYDLSKPFDLNERFDLLICLEVAEHLPLSSAKDFADSLCKHSNNIIFSAAVPGQWGQNHLNEQWPEFWFELFKANGYFVADSIRPIIWQNQQIEWWYKQNIFIFTKDPINVSFDQPIYTSLIHPEHFNQKQKYIQQLEERIYALQSELERWKVGKMGLSKHFNTFLASIKNRFFSS